MTSCGSGEDVHLLDQAIVATSFITLLLFNERSVMTNNELE